MMCVRARHSPLGSLIAQRYMAANHARIYDARRRVCKRERDAIYNGLILSLAICICNSGIIHTSNGGDGFTLAAGWTTICVYISWRPISNGSCHVHGTAAVDGEWVDAGRSDSGGFVPYRDVDTFPQMGQQCAALDAFTLRSARFERSPPSMPRAAQHIPQDAFVRSLDVWFGFFFSLVSHAYIYYVSCCTYVHFVWHVFVLLQFI